MILNPAQDIRIGGRMSSAAYQFTLQSQDLDALKYWAPIVYENLKKIPILVDVNSDQQNAGLQASVIVDRDTASRLGLSAAQIDAALYSSFGQRPVSTMYTALNQYHVVLEVDPRFQTGPEALSSIYVPSFAGQQVPLSTLTKSEVIAAPIVVNHQGLFPSTTISFNLKPGVALGDAVNAIRQIEQQSGKPASLVTTFQGNANAFLSALSGEVLLIAAALVVIYIILGVLYESLVHPVPSGGAWSL